MANYRIDKGGQWSTYLGIEIDESDDRVYVAVNDNGDYSTINIDRNDFLETIRAILEEND